LIGVCSYLLIGYWSHRLAAVKSAQKAILVNRVSDGMLLWGILIVVIIIVVCVLMGDKCKMYRLNSEARNALPTVSAVTDSASASTGITSSSVAAPASSTLSVGNSTSASEVRKELANLFKAYA
jgi:heme/copper-type cytochrome/quinol oxidase subunit 2